MLCGPDAEIYSVWLQGSSVFISIFNNLTIPGQSFTYLHFFQICLPSSFGNGCAAITVWFKSCTNTCLDHVSSESVI